MSSFAIASVVFGCSFGAALIGMVLHVKLPDHHLDTALAEGRRVADRPAEPSHYLAVYDLWKRRDSRVSMQFVNHTGTMIAELAACRT